MQVSVKQAEEAFRFVIIEARDWFGQETGDERDEKIFFWPWLEKVRPEIGELSNITEKQFHRRLSEWFGKFKAATAVYLRIKALTEKGASGSFDVGYGLTMEIEDARRFAPAFLTNRQTAGDSYAAEYFEVLVRKLEAWSLSASGYGRELPYSDFWSWFRTTVVYEKFAKLEAEIEKLLNSGIGLDGRRRIEDLACKWDDSMRWAINEFRNDRKVLNNERHL
jgi:hypothetical protein